VDLHLLALLRPLHSEDWAAPAIVTGWQVRVIVAHLLDTATGKVAAAAGWLCGSASNRYAWQ
jgi:hypothetical protein